MALKVIFTILKILIVEFKEKNHVCLEIKGASIIAVILA